MPILSDEELDDAIAAEDIGAITLDTSIIDRFGREFRHPMLRSLSQFAGTGTQVVFSDIVAREVQSHIERDAAQSLVEIKKALGQYRKAWHLGETIEELGSSARLTGDPKAFAQAAWENFLIDVEGKQLPAADTLPLTALVDSYFNATPPFELEGKKKTEFPDAIALLSLEEWARRQNIKILAISVDNGWRSFARASDHVVVVQDIAKVYGHFNRADNFVANRIAKLIESGRMPSLEGKLRQIIENHFDDFSLEVDADSDFQFETEFGGVDVLRCTMLSGFQVVAADKESIDIALEYSCHIRFNAQFDWYVWDSVDREDISMGSDLLSRDETNAFVEIVAKFTREFDEIPDVLGVEASVLPEIPDFGTVEPHWRGNEPD